VFQEETRRPTRNPKVGRAVKGVITGLGAIGVVVMTAIFAIGLFAFKQIMKTKFGEDSGGGAGEPSSFQSSEPGFSFPKTFIGEEAGEPMLHDFEPNDLTGYEVTDDTGQVFATDNLVNELYSEEDSFSDVDTSFAEKGETSYGQDSASYQ